MEQLFLVPEACPEQSGVCLEQLADDWGKEAK